MIIYKRTIEEIDIFVFIEKHLFIKERDIFESIFNTFFMTDLPTEYHNGLLITTTFETGVEYKDVFYCDISNPSWVYMLICFMESYFSRITHSTVIHSSCIKLHNRVILFSGARLSGKSSLAKKMVEKYNADFLADDFVFIVNKKIYGFRFPISMRFTSHDDHYFLQTKDLNQNTRYLYYVPGVFSLSKTIDLIIFPSYDSAKCNYINVRKIDKRHAFNNLMLNVKYFETNRDLLLDISMIAASAKAFYVEYNNVDCFGEYFNNFLVSESCNF